MNYIKKFKSDFGKYKRIISKKQEDKSKKPVEILNNYIKPKTHRAVRVVLMIGVTEGHKEKTHTTTPSLFLYLKRTCYV